MTFSKKGIRENPLCYNKKDVIRRFTEMLIKNARIVTWSKPNVMLEGAAIQIFGERILGIIESKDVDRFLSANPSEEIVDAHKQLVMPGGICAHTHFYGAFSRGMGIKGNPPQAFPEILKQLWWPLDKALDVKACRFSAQVCLVDAIRHGTTTLIDHHASQSAIGGSLSELAEVVLETGVRADLCYEVTDRDGEAAAREGIHENVRFIESIGKDKKGSERLGAHFGLHANLTLSDKTLAACQQAIPKDTGFHIHVAEHTSDEYDALDKAGMRIVDRLYKFGILGKRTILAHGVNIDLQEASLIKETGTWLTHQPRSNMNNAVGMADVEGFMRFGVKVGLGNDGFSNSMWEEWKTCYLAHKLWHRDPRRMSGSDVAQMAIYNNAELAQMCFPGVRLGVIEPGAAADLIFVDYQPFTELNAANIPWHIIFGFHDSMITSTMVAGNFLMRDRVLLTIDEERIMEEARRYSKIVWERFNQISKK
jgi:putative selenium metabolism protein SsnA